LLGARIESADRLDKPPKDAAQGIPAFRPWRLCTAPASAPKIVQNALIRQLVTKRLQGDKPIYRRLSGLSRHHNHLWICLVFHQTDRAIEMFGT
jgi:hypothetical protein